MKSWALFVVLGIVLTIQHATSLRTHTKKGFLANTMTDNYQQLPGKARDIAVGADGTLWSLGTAEEDDGYAVYRMKKGTSTWEKIPGSGVAISVDIFGNGWIVTKSQKIMKFGVSKFQPYPGPKAIDIAAVADGAYYVVQPNNDIYRKLAGWEQIPGKAIQIAANSNFDIWYLNEAGEIYRKTTLGKWKKMPGQASDIDVGNNGRVAIITGPPSKTFIVGGGGVTSKGTGFGTLSNSNIAYWSEEGQKWVNVPGLQIKVLNMNTLVPAVGSRIAVDPEGNLLFVDQLQNIMKIFI